MLWVLWDIVLPLIAAFLLGLLTGWLLWRWRRRRIDAEGISTLRRSSARYKADAERLHQSNIELSDRLQAANGVGGGELANAKKRIDMLGNELKSSRREVAELKSGGRSTARSGDQATQRRIHELETQLRLAQQNGQTDGTAEWQKEINSRDRMISTLRKSIEQFGERGDTTALMADVELRDRRIQALEEIVSKLKG